MTPFYLRLLHHVSGRALFHVTDLFAKDGFKNAWNMDVILQKITSSAAGPFATINLSHELSYMYFNALHV